MGKLADSFLKVHNSHNIGFIIAILGVALFLLWSVQESHAFHNASVGKLSRLCLIIVLSVRKVKWVGLHKQSN